jgi:endoglucanase
MFSLRTRLGAIRVHWGAIGLVLALILIGVSSGDRAHAESNWPFRKGASIHNMMNWATVEAGNPQRYAWPPFAGPRFHVSDALLRNLAQAGFTFIRLTVDPGPFLQFRNEHRQALDRDLVQAVRRLFQHGFAVIVDFHPTSQVSAYAPEKLTASETDPLFLAYVQMVRRTAGILAPLGPRVALELMNEPQYGWDTATAQRWQRMLEILHREARAEAPDLLLVLSGARGGNSDGLMALDPTPFAGSRVLYTFHYYEPYLFTHEGVRSTVPSAWPWRFISGLPYPPESGRQEEAWRKIRANINSDASLTPAERARALVQVREAVTKYFASGFGAARIGADFEMVRRWAIEHAIDPRDILLGEFGVTRTYEFYRASDPASQEAWLRDVRVEAERRGFSWTIWAVSGYGGMALVRTDEVDDLDPVSLRGLGLNLNKAFNH